MSNINLKRFVDIDIVQHVASIVTGTRDTVVLFTSEETDGQEHIVSSLSDANTLYASKPKTLAYLQMYFLNGGAKVRVIENTSYSDITNDVLSSLNNTDICVAYAASDSEKASAYAALKALAIARSAEQTVYGINEKLILAATADENDTASVKNFIVKYATVPGAEMTIAAYLSKIDVYGIDTVYDYAFTQEILSRTTPTLAEDITDTKYGIIIRNNMNVDVYLANAVRNCGGNCKDGADIVNNFVRIVLHQTLTDRLLTLLTQKIKSTSGISKIYTVIANELERYLTCGYLTTDKVWTDEDLKISYNQALYTIIEKGTALTSGYVMRILPFSALTDQDKAQRKAPPIYIVLADQYGIRQITINGEVI